MFAALVEKLIVNDDAALVERLRQNELDCRRLAAEQAAITREVERRGLFHDDGHRSLTAFLRANLALSTSQATHMVRVARLLDTVRGAGDALLDGHIGVAQANELGRLRANPRVGDRLDRIAPILLEAAEQLGYEDLRIATLRWEALADTDGAEQCAAANVEHRSATVTDVGGELFVRASGGTAVGAAEMAAVFDSFVEHEFRVDCAARDAEHGVSAPTSLLPRTDAQRRHDAMLHIFRSADAAVVAGITVGPIPAVVNIVATQFDVEHAFAGIGLIPAPHDLVEPPLKLRRRETTSGSPISNTELAQAAIHGRVRSVVFDHTGMPVSYGRTRRLFTGPIREMAKLLGHHCSQPGCNVPAERCEIDHVTEFGRGHGDTSIANAGLECSSHNRFKHRSRLTRSRLATDQVVTTRADGTDMGPVGQRSAAEARRAKRPHRPSFHPEVIAAIFAPAATGQPIDPLHVEMIDGEYRIAA